MLWDSIRPSHGFIAMDEEWAFQRDWPESMRLPSDRSKRVYLLEAYHQIHCLVSVLPAITSFWLIHNVILINGSQRILQKTFWEAVEKKPYTWDPSTHMTHCFDALRQVRSSVWIVISFSWLCFSETVDMFKDESRKCRILNCLIVLIIGLRYGSRLFSAMPIAHRFTHSVILQLAMVRCTVAEIGANYEIMQRRIRPATRIA